MKDNEIPKYSGPDTLNRTEKMSKAEIKNRFDNETAALYSRRDPAWLPDFGYAFDLMSQLIRPFVKSGSRILDIGAGTGNLSRTILEKIGGIHATLLDFSGNMLDEAPNVLASFKGMFDIINADFMTYDIGAGHYNAAVSSFAIHHLREDREYLALYKKIFESLSEPGIFACCDVVAGSTTEISELNEEEWTRYLRSRDFKEADITKILSNYKIEDSPISLSKHTELLGKAGFDTTDVIWKKANFGIYVGIKTS
jgi:tRNA (cmo5U34)-methyltransferase